MSENQPPPPPPPDGPGAPPPPPGGYDGPPAQQAAVGGAGPWDLGSALSYGWAKFQANAAQLVIATLAIVAGAIVIFGIYFAVNAALPGAELECSERVDGFCIDYDASDGTPGFVRFGLAMLFYVLFFVYAQVVGSGIIRGALGITEGRPFQAAEVFKFTNLGPVLVTSLIVGGATFVGVLLCVIPGIIVAFLTSYSLFFVIDKNLAPVDAIKASIEFTRNNLGQTLIWYIVGGIIAEIGFLVCGVGALVSVPVVIVGTAYTYKKLTGQQVVA